MKVSDKIYFDLTTESVPSSIYPLLTYENPEYFQKMNMGLNVTWTPKTIETYRIMNNVLEIPRGEAMRIKPYFPAEQWKPQFEHSDHPIKLQYVNNDFKLDDYQLAAVESMKRSRQGIIHAVTSAGKSLIMLKAIVEIGQRALIVVHRKILMVQLLEDIDKYIRDENGQKISAGIIGNGHVRIGDITIAIDKTLARNLSKFKEEFGSVILDECHLAPASTVFQLLNGINSRNRYGLSGTLKRKDQKEFLIYSTFGQVISTISKDQLLDKGRVVPVRIEVIESQTRFDWDSVVEALIEEDHKNPTQAARQLQDKTIAQDPGRNDLILERVVRLKGKTLILSRFVDPCYALQAALLARFGLDSGVITGRDSKEALASYAAMKDGDSQRIFATIGCVATGVSISDLDYIVLISPIHTNELLLHQIRGRLMRTAQGKTHGTLIFVHDPYIFEPRKLKGFIRIMEN